jgi:fatty acid desaturase
MSKAAHNESINVDSRIADISKVQAELSEYQWYVLEVVRGAQYDPTIAILRSMIAFAGVLILGAATASIWTPIFRV